MCVEKANGSSEEQKWKSERSGVLWASSLCFKQSVSRTNICCFKAVLFKCDTHGKNILKREKQWPKLKERDTWYAKQIPTCLTSKGSFSIPALCSRYVPEFGHLSLNYVMSLSTIYGNLCTGSHINV